MWMRRAVAVGALVAAIGLTGCGPTADIAARIVDGNLEFAFCSPFRYEWIQIAERSSNLAWSLKGTPTSPNAVVRYPEVPPGMTVVIPARDLDLNADFILITFVSGAAEYVGHFEPRSMTDEWVESGGAVREGACEA